MKNNDERKEFIDNYTEWQLWLETKETGERYYRYDFQNGDAFVVKVYYRRFCNYAAVSGDLKITYENRYGSEEYYLLKQGEFFKDCQTNRSILVEYLKDIQKNR